MSSFYFKICEMYTVCDQIIEIRNNKLMDVDLEGGLPFSGTYGLSAL